MRRDARFGHAVHLLRTNLHFDGDAVRSEKSGVQRLIAVHPRDRNVVLETPRHGLVDAVYQPQHAIADVRAVDDDAKSVDIHHLVERDFLVLHLFVDAVQMLLTALHRADDRRFFQRILEGVGDLGDEFLLVAAGLFQLTLEHFVAVGVKRAKSQILELEFHGIETQALGDGRIDFQSLACGATSLDGRHRSQGTHVVHAIGELDHDDADVAHHGQEHFTKTLGLSLLAILELDLIQLADAVHQFGDHLSEYRCDLRFGGRRIFDDIVQDGRHQGVGIETQVRENIGDRDRVRDVGFAGDALLSVMSFRAEVVSFPNPLDLRG